MKAQETQGPGANGESTRRKFLLTTGSTTIVAGLLGFMSATLRFLFPNVLYEPPSRFPVGVPDAFPTGTATFLPDQRLFVFNSDAGFYAISSICTHLGCNVNYVPGGGSPVRVTAANTMQTAR